MKIFVTGGAGFVGRYLVNKLLEDNHQVIILDNLSNSSKDNDIVVRKEVRDSAYKAKKRRH